MEIWNRTKDAIWDVTTGLISDTIALFSPRMAAMYRQGRQAYKRAYLASKVSGPYGLHRPTNKSGDAEVLPAWKTATAKVRDLERNNPFFAGMIRKNATMVIGDEVGIKAQVTDSTGEPIRALNDELEKRFYRWAESAGAGGESLTELLHKVENALMLDGEVVIKEVLKQKRGPGKKENPFRLQVLERDYIDENENSQETGTQYGIQYDKFGLPVAFWLFKQHPQGVECSSLTSEKHSADGIFFMAETTRPSQKRGISPFASAVFKLYGIEDLEDAELLASRAAASFGLIIKSQQPEWNPYTGSDGTATSPEDDNGRPLEYLQSGGVMRLDPGEDAMSFKNERPNSNFDSFVRGRQRQSASPIAMSYETATGDFSQVNYSSARMGHIIQWQNVRRRQARHRKLLNWTYRKWLAFEAMLGISGLPLAQYNQDKERFDTVSWQLAGNDSVDPVKEVSAFEKELAMGVNSRTRYASERGRDFPEILKEIQMEKEAMQVAGIYQESPIVPKTVSESESTSTSKVEE